MLHGQNPFSPVFLGWLGLTTDDVGRFRDCYLADQDGERRIVIYTRNGGGNRDDYEHVTDTLRAHPSYVTDYDDDYDCTYASYEFRVPAPWQAAAAAFTAEDKTPAERMQDLLAKLQAAPKDDPEVVRAMEKFAPVMDAITKALGR